MNKELLQNHNIIYSTHDTRSNSIKVEELLTRIIDSKNETSTRLFMVTEAYDKYNREYYIISLTILILSSVINIYRGDKIINY